MDFVVFSDKEKMFIPFFIGKKDITVVSEKLWTDICAGAFQHRIGLLFDLKAELYAFYCRTGKEQGTENKKGNIVFIEKKDKPGKKTADSDRKGQNQPPE